MTILRLGQLQEQVTAKANTGVLRCAQNDKSDGQENKTQISFGNDKQENDPRNRVSLAEGQKGEEA